MGRLVQGVGVTSKGIHLATIGRRHTKVYSVWKDMIYRGYSEVYKNKHTSYKEVTVCVEWCDFQVFGDWFLLNYKEGFQLDKDILKKDNLVYCPEYCRFIPQEINKLFTNRKGKGRNTSLPLGVSPTKGKVIRYLAYCNNGSGEPVNLVTYCTPEEAGDHYVEYKEALVKTIAETCYDNGYIDNDVRQALLDWVID